MQTFYVRLCQVLETDAPYWRNLARLRRITAAQLAVLESDLAWTIWTAGTA